MDFRLFYNHSIHPELMHLEQRRRRLVRLLLLAGLLLLGVVAVQVYLGIFLITLLLLIPVGMGIAYLAFRIRVFFAEFKPRVVEAILDYIDNDVNYSFTKYAPQGSISKQQFLASRIFTTASDFWGEDLVVGQVRETPFEMSELRVREFSPVRDRLDYVFRGVFLIGDYKRWDMHGSVLLLPDAYRKYLSRSERAFHLLGGRRVQGNLLPDFEAFFDTYATPEVRIQDVISEELQVAILQFRKDFQEQNRQKEIYLSIIGDKIYIALTQDRDLLEPSLWRNNVSYGLVREFYDDLSMLLDLVRHVDVMN
ncbi:MAG TPA: DUF3137 domain-containing protein [Saprospiraceae bacterium]|nr:DUF3137 domain-containing protein [Saprospiraceae bacterium]